MPYAYLLLDLTTAKATRLQQMMDAGGPLPGQRELPDQIAHIRDSVDQQWAIYMANLTDQELRTAVRQTWVTQLGTYNPTTGLADQAVYDYIAANLALWQYPAPPGGGS